MNVVPRSSRPLEADDDKIKAMLESRHGKLQRHSTQSAIHDHLKKLGFVASLGSS